MSPPTDPTAIQKRALHPAFVTTFSYAALRHRLPLRFPVPEALPPSPKHQYRSWYRYLGAADLADSAVLADLTPFEVALRLIDFSPLRDYLAQAYYTGCTKGQVPFDPVSLFLCVCLRRELKLSWRDLAKLLAGEHGAGWRRRLGFREGETPSASGLRYFFTTLGEAVFDELCPLFIDLLHHNDLLPRQSTYPGDPPHRGVTVSHDIMLHPARSRMKCSQVTDTCYQPAPRPCPAQAAGLEGCDCTATACHEVCRRATPLDPEARFIQYAGNKYADLTGQTAGSKRSVYGYASNPDRLLDDRFACAWMLRTGLHPANVDERNLFPASFAQLRARFPYLKLGELLADAALGYQSCLDPIWDAGALRMVDIRAADGDTDPAIQLRRGYDAHGYPVCLHGYRLRPNGHDYGRRRTKWCCSQVCLTPRADGAHLDPPYVTPDCPFQAPKHKHGQVVNVRRTLPDGRYRLAREVPYGSATWKRRFGRRNLSESRNGSLEHLGLKRLPNFGLAHNRREMAVADFLLNLHTLGRLVLEATTLALKSA